MPPLKKQTSIYGLGQALQALQGERAAGFGRDHQAGGTVLVAQDDDAAAAQFGQGAFNGG